MEAVQAQIDALDKESKELITQAQRSITQAVQQDGIAPQRIAVALAQRFSAERIALSFPIVCLLDAMLQPAGDGTSEAAADVLAEFWPLVTPLFAHYHSGPAALRDKVTRLVGRWRLRQRIPRELAEALVSCMEKGAPVTTEGTGAEATAATRASAVAAYTQAEITSYRDLLRSIVGLLERLPAEQAAQYAEAVLKERLAGPTPAARTVLQGIHTELRREVTSQQAGGPHAPAVAEADDSGEAREALGKLLDQLSSATAAGGTAAGAHLTSVVRYQNPLVSDIAQRQSVGQRTGFGPLQPHPSTTGAGALYYPRRSTDARLPFRIPPAKQAGGGAVRLAFPTPEEWLAAKDMATLALFEGQDAVEGRSTSSVFDVARKRTRE